MSDTSSRHPFVRLVVGIVATLALGAGATISCVGDAPGVGPIEPLQDDDGGLDGGSDSDTPDSASEGAGVVTPAGGTVSLGSTEVTVPPGAVAEPTTITIKEVVPSSVAALPGEHRAIGPMIALMPHGLTFMLPVTVSLAHTATSPLLSHAVLRLDNEEDTSWEHVASPTFSANSVSFSTTTFSVLAPVDASSECSVPLVISKIYVVGGTSPDYPNNDFVELHNRSAVPLNLNGAALQMNDGSSTSTWSVVPLSGTLEAGGFYLVALGRDEQETGKALPAADATGSYNLSTMGGRVAITQGTTPLTGSGPWTFVSGVAYGETTFTLENAAASIDMNPGHILQRLEGGCAQTGINSEDLMVVNYPGTGPFNTASSPILCSCL